MMLEEGCKDEPAFLNGWFTDATKASFKAMKNEVESTSGRVQKAKVRDQWLANALTKCGNQPMLVVDNCSVDAWMAFLQTFRTSKGKLLGKTSLGVKCSALYHLFRCHDAMGMPGGHDSDGKLPMSYKLYVKCCQWLLEKGDDRSIFCHCFLVLTWNLMCRANNTVTILFEHMQWQADHLELLFCQQKNDTTGEKQRFPRRLYANPQQPEVCPIFALALYLGLRDGRSEMNGKLFQGNSQYKHFMDGLSNVLKEHESELLYMGYVSYTEIGSHSIRKGATKWLSGQPGGPSSISICIRGGWSLGGVKDVYMTYEAEGDAFVGRMLSLLPLLKSEFAVSAPEFTDLSTEELDRHITRVFPGLAEHNQMKPILHRCLAAMAHNKDHVLQ
ncbi:unnamed protein product [Cylindrotheca closterium]|uniref:Uncharacterized protein n=2 Tax=Cylindrotheca closterium TaxID=2856 RepID=A0AAD2G8Q5_9STRA|nr:unnamed protein product [Cylindrotheca closterium]